MAWGIWLARNQSLFEAMNLSRSRCALQCLNILYFYPQFKIVAKPLQIQIEYIDNLKPWAYFDGAAQGNIVGAGGLIFKIDSCFYSLKENIVEGTNNIA